MSSPYILRFPSRPDAPKKFIPSQPGISEDDFLDLAKEVESEMSRIGFKDESADAAHGVCRLPFNVIGGLALVRRGFPAQLQGGAVRWARVPFDEIPSEEIAYFALPDETKEADVLDTERRLESEVLFQPPHFHTWLQIEGAGDIVDFSTGSFVGLAARRRLPWRGEEPPDAFWGPQQPPLVAYEASISASMIAFQFACRIWGEAACSLVRVEEERSDGNVVLAPSLVEVPGKRASWVRW